MSPINDQSEHLKPVVEAARDGATLVDPTTRALHLRIRQQEILAELGVLALSGNTVPRITKSHFASYC